MLTKISKWIQDSFRITPKIESLVVFAIPDIPWKFQKKFFQNFLIYLANKQTNMCSGKNRAGFREDRGGPGPRPPTIRGCPTKLLNF